jgi:hypothetical protein
MDTVQDILSAILGVVQVLSLIVQLLGLFGI